MPHENLINQSNCPNSQGRKKKMNSKSSSKSITSKSLIHLLVVAILAGLLLAVGKNFVLGSENDSTTLIGLEFPLISADVWKEHDSLVPTRLARTVTPWKESVYNNIYQSYGKKAASFLNTKETCRTPRLDVQVDNPFRSESAVGRIKRSYVCLRFSKQCRGQAMEELWNRRYMKKYDTYTGTFLMTDTTALNRLKRDDKEEFEKLMKGEEGESYISAFDGGDAISGNKAKQLSTKKLYTEDFSCDYNSLNIQPAQFTMHHPKECRKFFEFAALNPDSYWIKKPILGQGGTGITLHTSAKDFDYLKGCKKASSKSNTGKTKVIIQHYIKRPLLIHGKKFDIRVYMLVSSSNPFFVFYHPGYLRRSMVNYKQNSTENSVFLTNTHYQSLEKNFELQDHIWGFERFQKYLSDHNVAGSQYVSTVLNSAIKKVLLFNFMSAKEELVRRKGSYHLFGLDFMIDDQLRVHFIEANGYPGFTWSKDFPTRRMVTSMFDMLLELHEAPTAFEKMTQGDMYGDFELLYNELEDDCSEKMYDPCVEFSNFNKDLMKEEARKISLIHDTKRRTDYVARKQLDNDVKTAQKACQKSNLDVASAGCSKLMKKDRRTKFGSLFKKIQAWNTINKFVAGM